MKRRTPKQSEFSNRWNMSTWRKVRYLKNICVSDYHNVRHLFEAWWHIFLIPAYLKTTKNIFPVTTRGYKSRKQHGKWRKVRYLKNICVSDYHNVRHLFEAWWQIFLIPAYLTTAKSIFLRNKLEAQPAQNRLFGITQGETFGEISKLEQLFYFVSGAQWAPVYVRWSVLTTLARILSLSNAKAADENLPGLLTS